MSREDIEKLLGGYATGTLSEAERRRLFDAALEDQEIFALLAREQDFKDLLAAPGAREELLAALENEPALAGAAPAAARAAPAPEEAGFWSWLTQPWPWAVAATAAFTAILFFALRPPPAPLETAAAVQQERAAREREKQEPVKPAERPAVPVPQPAPALRGSGTAPLARGSVAPAAPPAAPAPDSASADREVRLETKKAVATAPAVIGEKVTVDAPRPAEADRKADEASAIAPPSPRKEMPPGATVQPALRDDLARGASPAPQLAKARANEAAPALRYRLGTPAFQPGREAEIFVTASRDGVLVVERRAGEAWERLAALRVRENQETRVSIPTRGADRELEIDLSLVDAPALGASGGFRRADRQETPRGLRVRIPRAE